MNTDTAPYRPLAETNFSRGSDSSKWSHAIAERYHLTLSPELADWFDSDVCEGLGQGQFCEPANPEDLLGEAPDCIWPGLMPPDVMPLVTNGLGDWLCGRVGANNTIDQIIYWYHGGGDHLPYGDNLAHAIFFDAVADRLPGRRQVLAIPALREEMPCDSLRCNALLRWSLRHMPAGAASIAESEQNASDDDIQALVRYLFDNEIALDAVRCDQVLAALDNDLRVRLEPSSASVLGVSWDHEIAKWMFDTSSMGDASRSNVRRLIGDDARLDQDWETVQHVCHQMANQGSDLAWVYDCLGWAAQRRGDVADAIASYQKGALASIFTDQAVRFRTHFDSHRCAKFSAARLLELGEPTAVDGEYLSALSQVQRPQWREGVVNYWTNKASQTPDAAERYSLWYRAGWDVGCDSMQRYHHLLRNLAESATAAGQSARAEIANTHAACIEQRYLRRR